MPIPAAPTFAGRDGALGELLARVSTAEPLGREDAYALGRMPAHALAPVFAAAACLRSAAHGDVVTYSPKVFLPVTNLCRDHCSYCTFRKDPTDADAWTMTRAEIRDCVRRGRVVGCTEALLCVGDKPEAAFMSYRETLAALGHASTVTYVREACEIAIEEGMLPHSNVGVLTREQMRSLRPVNASLGLMLENVSPRLRGKGMPHYHAPDKDPGLRLRMLAEAGELAIPFTTGILIGIGETWEERVDSLIAIRDVQERYGHIQEVIVQNFRAKPATRMSTVPEPEAIEIARTVAVARLLLGPRMNLQAPPNLNPGAHRLMLDAGINDWGGISPVTCDYVNPEAAWPEIASLERTCKDAGFNLMPRLCVYPEFITRAWIDPALMPRVAGMETARVAGFSPAGSCSGKDHNATAY